MTFRWTDFAEYDESSNGRNCAPCRSLGGTLALTVLPENIVSTHDSQIQTASPAIEYRSRERRADLVAPTSAKSANILHSRRHRNCCDLRNSERVAQCNGPGGAIRRTDAPTFRNNDHTAWGRNAGGQPNVRNDTFLALLDSICDCPRHEHFGICWPSWSHAGIAQGHSWSSSSFTGSSRQSATTVCGSV